ncbi:hypothetical protein BD626DRAFT_459896 [Schizophyllum amplum]|uniref:F-box domain-containing protein n=1 Tax=Schizophyllum amplum TaxID=97359 RepID=A0A550CA32_9AGAR|nr:hypothetical protein BD626DRAFT_459896 [Auriculariopsis ampla]
MMCGEIDDLSVHPRDPRMYPVHTRFRAFPYCRTAFILGHICSRWLKVTRGCPRLWTTVDLPFPQKIDVSVLTLCLRYSAGLPLTLHINDNRDYPARRRNIDTYRRFMRMVASTSHRWIGIHIFILGEEPKMSDLFEPLYSVPMGSFSSLKSVTLRPVRFVDDDGMRATLRLWDTFYSSSAVRAVRWFGVAVDVVNHAHSLHLLTHVGVNCILSHEVMDLLRACPRLEVFQGTVVHPPGLFPGTADGYLIPASTTPIALPHLRILVLSGMSDWSNLFDGLAVPLLNRLELSITDIQAHAIERLLERSEAKLAMLALRHISCENVEQIKALLRCPALRRLKIFVYQPSEGSSECEDRWYFNPKRFVPANVVLCTKMYEHADSFYRAAICIYVDALRTHSDH